MAIMRETTTMRTFFITFLFVSIITAIFFRAAPTVALIVIPPNKKHRLLFSNRCWFTYLIIIMFQSKGTSYLPIHSG